ncbi:DUF4340 domain-containing protein [Zavarzinia sp.]|uniref:DUF4340 domain-containing protein n=1 Tax=Zavarzinia sp. TaxID=2027920 RepID=UPI003BB6228C
MRRSTLAILLGLTLLLAAVGAWLVADKLAQTRADLSGQLMLPGLKARLNDVSEIDVAGAEGRFTLKRVGANHWVMAEKGDYPADFGKVQRLLLALADLRAIEPKTARPDRFHFIDVEDIGPGTRGLQLTVKGPDGTAFGDMIFGKPSSVMGAAKVPRFFVRPAGQNQSWEAEADVRLERDAAQWLERDLVVIAPDRFRAASVTIDGAAARVSRARPGDAFTLDGLDAGSEQVKPARVNALSVAASYLALEDVQPADKAPAGTPLGHVVFETFDGITLTLDLVSIEGQGWARIDAAFDATIAGEGRLLAPVSDAGGKPVVRPAEEARAEAGAIAARTKGWLYRLDGTRVIDLTPKRGDLSEARPAAAPAPETPVEAAPVPPAQ